MRGHIYCDMCGAHNQHGLSKCQTCGTPQTIEVMVACSACGMQNPRSSRACSKCGSHHRTRNNPITSAEFANMKMAVFDLDMTLLDNKQRFTDAVRAGIIDKTGAPKKKGGWKTRGEFLYQPSRLAKDRLMNNAMDLIEYLMKDGYVIAYCTARPFNYYEVTKDQLEDKGLPIFQDSLGQDLLFCKRSMGQKTPLYKAEVIRQLKAQYDVRLFFDDKYENCAAVLREGVPGVYGSIEEYYGMIAGVKNNPYTTDKETGKVIFIPDPENIKYGGTGDIDPDADPYDTASSHMDTSGMGRVPMARRKNPSMMYSPMDLESAYESIKGTKIQTKPGPKGEMCGGCVYMCPTSGNCKKWTEMKGSPVYVARDWYCKAYESRPKSNPIKRGRDSKGSYMRWGGSGKKYYYKAGSKASREKARKKAHKQAKAAFAGGYRGNPDDPDPEVIVRYETIDGHRMPINAYGLVPPSEHKRVVAETAKLQAEIDQLARENPHDEGIIRSEMMEPVWKMRVRYILDQEGGASGLDPLMKAFPKGTTKKEARKLLTKVHDVRKHSAGDYIWDNPRRNGEEHSEDYMVPRDVDTLGKAADRIEDTYYEGLEVPEWWKSKLSVTADRADSLADAVSYVADNPNEMLKIYSGEPKSKFKNMGAIFAEVQMGRNIAADTNEIVQSIYRGLVGGRTTAAEKRMAMAVAVMQKELSDRAEAAGGNAIANLRVDYEMIQGTATITIIAHADAIKMARKPKSNPPRSNPPKNKVKKAKELYKHMNGKMPSKVETAELDIGDVWYQVGEGGCWQIGYMSGKETGNSAQKYVHHFNEETKNGDFPKLYATIPDEGKPMLIITGGTWKIKTDEQGVAWIYD